MKKFAKIICVLLGFCLCAGGFAACGDKKSGGEVVLSVWVPEEDMTYAKSIAEDFKKAHPEKTYDFQWAPQSEMNAATQVLTDVEAAADVFSFANDQLSRLVSGDALAQIGGTYLSDMEAQNDAEAVRACKLKVGETDRAYAFPYSDNTFFLFYNKAKFNETDIQTLDGILAKCSATEQFAYPMQDGWYNSAFFFGKDLGYTVEYGASYTETKITTDFDNETGIKVTQSMYEYTQHVGFKADAGDSNITAGFNAGTVIAAATGVWNTRSIKRSLGDNFGVAKLPTYTYDHAGANEQAQLKAFAGYKLMGANRHSKNMADAVAFAAFYTNKQSQIKHFEARNFLPTNKEARQESAIVSDPCAQAIAAQLAVSKSQINVPSTLYEPLKGLGTAMINAGFDAETQIKAAANSIRKG